MSVANEVAAAVVKETVPTSQLKSEAMDVDGVAGPPPVVAPVVEPVAAAEAVGNGAAGDEGEGAATSAAVAPAAAAADPEAKQGTLGVAPEGEAGGEVKASFSEPGGDEKEEDKPVTESERKRRRRGWTEEEEKRLREGVAQHGAGQWAKIRDSYGFKSEHEGEGRTCVNLKDKWRNLNRPPRPEKPPKTEQAQRPPRKKKPRTPKRKRDSAAGGSTASPAADDDDGAPAPPPPWIPAAAAWCKANLERVDKGKVHVGALRTKFANSAEFFPDKSIYNDDEAELENLKYDLENPKTEASKRFRSDALEPYVGPDAIRQNCFIGGLNQLGVFGWAVRGEVATPPARAPVKPPDDTVAAQVAAEAAKLTADASKHLDAVPLAVPATLAGPEPDAPPKKRALIKNDQDHDDDQATLLNRVVRGVAAAIGASAPPDDQAAPRPPDDDHDKPLAPPEETAPLVDAAPEPVAPPQVVPDLVAPAHPVALAAQAE